jgi:excisionase family DNA binding protein
MSRPSSQLKRLLTVKQLAEILQVPEDTIYYWRSRGEGPRGFRVGRDVRFRESDVEAWLASQEDKA